MAIHRPENRRLLFKYIIFESITVNVLLFGLIYLFVKVIPPFFRKPSFLRKCHSSKKSKINQILNRKFRPNYNMI